MRTWSWVSTSASMSNGSARSTTYVGAGRAPASRWVREAATTSASMTVPRAPVTEMTRSAAAISRASDCGVSTSARPSTDAARRCARSSVRLRTVIERTPRRASVATDRPDIAPAPTMSTSASCRSPMCASAPPSAMSSSERATESSAVSACARLPTRSESCTVRESSPVSWPASCAPLYDWRSCPRICDSPIAIESRPDATVSMCSTALSSNRTYTWRARSSHGTPATVASAEPTSDRPPWNERTSAMISRRLHVDSTRAPSTNSPFSTRLRRSSTAPPESATDSRTDRGAERCETPRTKVVTTLPPGDRATIGRVRTRAPERGMLPALTARSATGPAALSPDRRAGPRVRRGRAPGRVRS